MTPPIGLYGRMIARLCLVKIFVVFAAAQMALFTIVINKGNKKSIFKQRRGETYAVMGNGITYELHACESRGGRK